MCDIPVGSQIFDIAFHPTTSTLFAALLTGEVKAFKFDENFRPSSTSDREAEEDAEAADSDKSVTKVRGMLKSTLKGGKTSVKIDGSSSRSSSLAPASEFAQELFTAKPSKRSCRGLALSKDGGSLYTAGKGKGIHTIDVSSGKVVNSRVGAHQTAINRIERLMANMLVTGDDDGVVKLWDPRKPDALRSYEQHFDFISDFMWIEDKKQVVVTSGDGTLSVIDVRSSKPTPLALSEDQEDELLSVVSIRGGSKIVVGTQIGILSIFNKSSGWGDCVDRIPGHPHSIDALCNLPSSYPSSHSTLLTGSSDGLLRAVQLFPTKLLGVVADHGEFPIERVKVDREGEGTWVGSVGHDEVVRMTWLGGVFEDEEGNEGRAREGCGSGSESESDSEEEEKGGKLGDATQKDVSDSDEVETDDEEMTPQPTSELTEKRKPKSTAHETADSDADNDVPAAAPNRDDSSSEEDLPKERKRKRKEKDPLAVGRKAKKTAKNAVSVDDASFFSGL